jgi:hypothetical protein
MEPDAVEFLRANPFNIRHLLGSVYGAADTLYHGRALSQEEKEGLLYAAFWHTPVWAIHIAHKFGAFKSHTGGFGYYKTLGLFPAAVAGLAYYTVGSEVAAAPYRSVAYTAGHDMRKHVGGGMSFRNPVTGM